MASYNRTNPGDAANYFIRNMLCDISEAYGELTKEDVERTKEYFNGLCPYTGEPLPPKTVLDHIVPQNQISCGLHLYGNIVPISKSVNGQKSGKNFEDFIRNETPGTPAAKEERIRKIKEFQEASGYLALIRDIGDLSERCQAEYRAITDRLKAIKREFAENVDQDVLQRYQAFRPQTQGATRRSRANRGEATISKSDAISLFRQHEIQIGTTVTFASMNSANNSCWANPPVGYLQREWWIILNDASNHKLYALCVPANAMNLNQLKVRADHPEKLDIAIDCDGDRFKDLRSKREFRRWYRASIEY